MFKLIFKLVGRPAIFVTCFTVVGVNLTAQPVRDSLGNIMEVRDIDGNVYKWIGIGPQTWMSENLKVTRFSNGDKIPLAPDSIEDISNEYYCNYNNDTLIGKIHGRLYNWGVIIDSRNVCPTGWHVPTNEDWLDLAGYVGGFYRAGDKLKAVDTALWNNPNMPPYRYNFAALLSGFRDTYNKYNHMGVAGYWWSSSESRDFSDQHWYYMRNWYWMITAKDSGLGAFHPLDWNFFSVRCIKDY